MLRWSPVRTRSRTRRIGCTQILEPRLVLAALPVAMADSYTVEAGMLSVAAAGLLANDIDADADPLIAQLAQQPAHGSLTLQADGSFQYTPEPGFVGIDSFSYRAVTPHPTQPFQLDRSQSTLEVRAVMHAPSFGTERESIDSSSLVGDLAARVAPSQSPFTDIHISDLDFVLADGLILVFTYSFFGSITANAPPSPSSDPELLPLRLEMVSPGPPAFVSADSFIQTNNEFALEGIADVNATGLIDGQIPEGPTDLSLDSILLDLPGSLSQTGQTVTVSIPITFSGSYEFDGGTIDLTMNGTVVARGPVAAAEASSATTVTLNVLPAAPPEIGRHLFYSNSAFDSPSASAAIAPGIEALLPGETSSGANLSSYVRGINGLIVDLPPGGSASQITAADFSFRVGTASDTTDWLPAADPASIVVEPGTGAEGSDRVTITWPQGAIADTWLQVTTHANSRTGLTNDDTFYFGNLRGDVTADGQVNANDFASVRSQGTTFLQQATIDAAQDTDRDRRINATDLLIVREHATTLSGGLPTITPNGGSLQKQAEQKPIAPPRTFADREQAESKTSSSEMPSIEIEDREEAALRDASYDRAILLLVQDESLTNQVELPPLEAVEMPELELDLRPW